jgi:NADPH:quinone reductase-like Zn-dependent oxidoreductase
MNEQSKTSAENVNSYIEWWEFAPRQNLLMVRVSPVDETKLKADSGIIIAVEPSKVLDRPTAGEVVAKGPEVKDIEIGQIVYFPGTATFDLGIVKHDEDGSYYQLIPEDRVDGIKVKDVRK